MLGHLAVESNEEVGVLDMDKGCIRQSNIFRYYLLFFDVLMIVVDKLEKIQLYFSLKGDQEN